MPFSVSVTKYLRSHNAQGMQAHLAQSVGTGKPKGMGTSIFLASGKGLLAACKHGRGLVW